MMTSPESALAAALKARLASIVQQARDAVARVAPVFEPIPIPDYDGPEVNRIIAPADTLRLAGIVENNADAIVADTVALADAIVGAIVGKAPSIRDAVLGRLATDWPERIPWPQPWVRAVVDDLREQEPLWVDLPDGTRKMVHLQGGPRRHEIEARAQAPALDALDMLLRHVALASWPREVALRDQTVARAALCYGSLALVENEPPDPQHQAEWRALRDFNNRRNNAEALEAIPASQRHDAARVAEERLPPEKRLAIGYPFLDNARRLVAWLYIDETTPARIAAHAARGANGGGRKNLSDLAQRELARAVEDALDRAPAPIADDAPDEAALGLDEELAALLETIGAEGRKQAQAVREKSAKRTTAKTAARWRRHAEPMRVPLLLAKALWADRVRAVVEEAAGRAGKVEAPTMHPTVRTLILLAPTGRTVPQPDGAVALGVDAHGSRHGMLPAVASVSLADDALKADPKKLRVVAPLAAWLAMQAHERWLRGESRSEWIPLPTGRDGLRAVMGTTEEEELDAALEWLAGVKVGGLPCIDASPPPEDFWISERGSKGGRPAKRRLIRVGPPLFPLGLEHVYRQAGMTLPPELRFFSPVLNPENVPRIGDHRTHARQRDFYSLGLGAFLIEKREEYADRGGVQIDSASWRRTLDNAGIYHRSHASLADAVLDAYRAPRRQPDLHGPRGPVLVETEPGSGRYRLGDDFEPQERVILAAAQRSGEARERRNRAARARKGGRTKPRG
jgi:hypothetical protein